MGLEDLTREHTLLGKVASEKMEEVPVKHNGSEGEDMKPEGNEDKKPLEEMSKSELIEAFKEAQEKADKSHDLYLRSVAEMENMKKRAAKEREDWHKYANETLIKDLLPVIDNLEKAIAHSCDQDVFHALREGVELTLKGLMDCLARSGLKEVEAEGVPFDPSFHEAVSELEDNQVESGIVLKELQKGYVLNGRLIRPSMVVVSSGPRDD